MSLDAIRSLGSVDPRQVYQGLTQAASRPAASFGQQLTDAIAEVDALQKRREDMVTRMVSGEVSEVHDVMTAAEEAQLAFELLLEVRNRLLESYQEIMRMQV